MSTALSGPASFLGLGVRDGVQRYFERVNAAGGVAGRMLRLVALDDRYEPALAAPNMRRLLAEEKVVAVLGNVGTPTAVVAAPIASEQRIPFFGAVTGAGVLRKTPPDRHVFNVRASYAEETAEIVRGLLDDLGVAPGELGFFTQNDAYGDAGHEGAVRALRARGYARADRLLHGRYPRNTEDVEDALSRFLDPRVRVKAVIMVGAYAPCARFIRLAKAHGLRALFVNVSFVGSEPLARALGTFGDGVVVTQVVPHWSMPLPLVREYTQSTPAAERSFVSLEGFTVAKAFVEVLRRTEPPFSTEQLVAALESRRPFDLGLGDQHVLSATEHQFSHRVWPTVLRGGEFRPFSDWREVRAAAAGLP